MFMVSLSLFLLCGFSSGLVEEEEVVAIKTFVSQSGVHPGGTIKIAFLLDILTGWHINATKITDEFLVSSQLILEEDDHINVLELYYPEGIMSAFSYSDSEIEIYEGEVILGALIKVRDGAAVGKHILEAKFLYQPCDDQTCMSPRTHDMRVPIQVVPASEQIIEINKDIFLKIHFKKKETTQ